MEALTEERIFLYLLIALTVVFLISSPTITGAAVAELGVQSSKYLIAIFVLVATLIAITLIFHFIRRKIIYYEPKMPGEEKSPLFSMRKKNPLSDKLDRISLEIQGLSEEVPAPPKIPKKITKMPTFEEKRLEKELNRLISKSKKPTVLDVPQRDKRLDSSLKFVEKELAELNRKEFEKVKFRESMPSSRKIGEAKEKERCERELKEIGSSLGEKTLPLFQKWFLNRKRKERKRMVEEEIKEELPKSELEEIEEKISQLKANEKK